MFQVSSRQGYKGGESKAYNRRNSHLDVTYSAFGLVNSFCLVSYLTFKIKHIS